MTRRNVVAAVACYAGVIVLALSFAVLRVYTVNRFAAQSAPDVLPENPAEEKHPPAKDSKPFFSLVTNRTYGTTDRARLWINYRGVEQLDFRVYKVKDPVQFFRQLENPHQVGEDETAEVGESVKRQPTFLEKLRAFKSSIYGAIKTYVRAQLQNQSRKGFNQKFRRPDEDEDEAKFRTPLNVSDYARVPLLNPSQMVSSWREKLPPLEDVYDRRMISLGKREPGVYLVEAVNGDLRAFGVTIVTDLTMVQKLSNDGQMLVYAVERKTGEPRGGVHIQVIKGETDMHGGETDKQGLLRLKLEKPKTVMVDKEAEGEGGGPSEEGDEADATGEPVNDSYLVVASKGDDFAISDLDSFYFNGGEGEYAGEEGGGSDPSVTSYLYTDRPVYRPEQKVYFKGILRRRTENGYRLLPGGKVNVAVDDPNSGRVYEQELTLSTRGTFSGELDLPEESPLGTYNITVTTAEATATGYFEVQEYKKPEYKVSVSVPARYVNAGETTKFNVSAKYFFGAPVARADVKYYVYRSRYYGWWAGEGGDEEDTGEEFGADPSADEAAGGDSYGGAEDQLMQEGEGKLDAQGRLEVQFKVPSPDAKELYDSTYRIEAQVTDPARRTMDASASFIGARANTVATAYAERYVYYQGDAARILVRAADREGRPVQTRVKLTFVERRWEKVIKKDEYGQEYPSYETKDKELAAASVDTNAQGQAAYDYAIQSPGSIHIKTTVEEQGRAVTSEAGYIWVADRNNQWTDFSYEEEETIKLVPDKKSYRVGETAHVLALLPTDKAHLLVTTELMSVLTVRQIDSTGRAVVIDVPIEARYTPDVFLSVTYVKNSDMYAQDLMLVVPARDKLLNLQIIPDKKEYKPRDPASYTILARNMDGSPAAGAEVSFGVVDESIYSIASESVEDIRRAFYGRRYNEVNTNFSINYSFTGYAGKKVVQLAANRRAFQLADFKNDTEFVNPKIRKIFKDTALWQPAVVTGADGKATVKVELPDNLTTWRATARAITADTRVGVAVEKVVARKDVILRLAMPRFLTEGDTVTLSGIVHNYLKQDKTTKININVTGARLLDAPEQMVTIPSQGEYRVNWRVNAPSTGNISLLAKALTDTESDAIETGLEVVPRGSKQVHAETVAIADDDAERTFTYKLPANAEQYSRRLRVEVAPSVAGTLFGALDYLTGFPYGCTEQTMSQFLPTVIVAQTLKEVQSASIKDTNDINRKVKRGLRRLYAYQHEDGGWGWWKDDPTDPFMSAYVVDGLTLAKRVGYEIDETRLERGREKLKSLIDSGKTDDGDAFDMEARAYLVYALDESGATDARYLNDLFNNRGKLQPYGRALLALALNERGDTKRAQAVAAEIERSVTTDATGAHWPSRRKTGHNVEESDDIEATALSLKALARISPQSAMLPQAARWLVLSRKHGHYWFSTKDTAFAIYGLTDYLKASQELSPDYTLEVYLNGEQVLTRQMTAADATTGQSVVIQRKGTEVGGASELRIVKHGHGMLYVSTAVTHYTDEDQTPAQGSAQLRISREYLRLGVVEDDNGALTWKTEPLSGELRSGDTIVSRLRVEGEKASYLLIEDPIPAGCEQVEQVSGIDLNRDAANGWSDWYSAREFHDQRAAFFLSYFDGDATYQYAMRVQVPGQFRIAPARVEQMYQPTMQANTAGGALTILDNK